MNKKTYLIISRFVFAGLSLAGVIAQLFVTITSNYSVVNFFSYFTILSNLIASIVFIIGAVRLIKGIEPTRFDDAIRGASIVYMIFVGIVFSVLLRDTDLGDLMPWVNVVHHYLMPVVVLIDWLVQPPKSKISLKTTLTWLAFPAVYVAYSLIRGAIVGFYAYPFFNPEVQGGYGGVALYCGVMLIAFLGVGLGIRLLANKPFSKRAK